MVLDGGLPNIQGEDKSMRKPMTAAFALSAVAFAAAMVTAQAENQSARPSQTASAARSTCTGMKAVCLSLEDLRVRLSTSDRFYGGTLEGARSFNEKVCNFYWEQCMKTAWWEGLLQHRTAERR